MRSINTNALMITPGSDVRLENIIIKERNAAEVKTSWLTSSVCNSERRRFNLTKSHGDTETFIGGHEAVGFLSDEMDAYIKRRYALLPHSNCLTRNDTQKCLACENGVENLCSKMRHAGLDEGTPSGFTNEMFVPKSQLYDVSDIDIGIAAFLEPLSCVIHSWDKIKFDYATGSNIINIIGGGPIGCLHALYINKKNKQNQIYIFESNVGRFETLKKQFSDLDSVTVTLGPCESHSDVTVMAASNDSAFKKSVEVTKENGSILLFSGFDNVSYTDETILPEIIHRHEFTHYASGRIFVGSSGYTADDLSKAKKVLSDFQIVKKILTGKVYGIDSNKLINFDGSVDEYDEPVLVKDIKGHFPEHIKILYINDTSGLIENL